MIVNKKPFTILSIILILTMFLTLGCSGSTAEEQEQVMETVVEVLTEEEKPEPTPEPTPVPWSFVDTYGLDSMISLDEYTNIIGLEDSDKQKLDVRIDIEGNNVWGGGLDVEGVPTEAAGFADIVFTVRSTFVYDIGDLKIRPTNQFTCGYYNYDIPMWVVCPQGLDTTGIDRWHVLVIGFQEDIPINHETHHGTVAAAMVPDNDPTGLWVPLPENPYDHWTGTSRWYPTRYQAGSDWSSQAYNSDWTENPANFFTVFYRNIAVFYLSAADMAVEYPAGRGTADWTYPAKWLETFSGDVEGGDPTLDPFRWGAESQITLTSKPESTSFLTEGFYLCPSFGCRLNYGGTMKEDNQFASCECSGCTKQPGCDCALFTDNVFKVAKQWYPYTLPKRWEHVADANQKTLLNPAIHYSCLCVKTTE